MTMGLHWVDGAIIVCYLAALAGVGVYFSRRQTSLDDYFRASRSMSWLPVGLSLMAALNSGLDYVQQPSSTILFGLVMVTSCASWLFLYPWLARVTLPFYRRLDVTSAYEYLERRFDVRVRTLAAAIFIVWRLGWMATAIYVPCFVVSTVTDGALPLLPTVVVLGAVVTFYTMLGGIKAVIWTDVIQFCVMMGGLLVAVAVVLDRVPGGVGAVWEAAHASGKTSVTTEIPGMAGAGWIDAVRLYLMHPMTMSGLFISAMVGRMATYTSDQVMVQRLQTTRSLKDARRAFVINAAGDTLWMVGLSFVGLALFAYFQIHPLPPDVTFAENTDRIFPAFMVREFHTGVRGLVIAAIFAASLSSIDSAINSCTSVVVVDFYQRLLRRRGGDDTRAELRFSRAATVTLGAAGTLLATQVGSLGAIIEISNRVIQSFTGPLFGIYLLGMFSARARGGGVLAGGLAGTAVSVYVAFFTRIGFLWPSTFGLLATLAVGYGASMGWMPPGPGGDGERLTWWKVMSQPEGGGGNGTGAVVPAGVGQG